MNDFKKPSPDSENSALMAEIEKKFDYIRQLMGKIKVVGEAMQELAPVLEGDTVPDEVLERSRKLTMESEFLNSELRNAHNEARALQKQANNFSSFSAGKDKIN